MKVLVERHAPLTKVTINRPERRNAVDHETAVALREAFTEFERDEAMSVAILTGIGGFFCAGYDLTTVGAGPSLDTPGGEGPMGPTRMLLSKPVIAAIEGHAVAGGLELALWCDLRVASATAVFGVFCRRWGVPLIDGGTVRLPRLIGHSRALDMILTGRPVGAQEALDFGLANRLAPAGEALAAAQALAADIAKFPQLCLRTDRMTSYLQWGDALPDALRRESRAGEAPLREEAAKGRRALRADSVAGVASTRSEPSRNDTDATPGLTLH